MTNKINEDTVVSFLESQHNIFITDVMLECEIGGDLAEVSCYYSDSDCPNEEDPFDWCSNNFTVDLKSQDFLKFLNNKND